MKTHEICLHSLRIGITDFMVDLCLLYQENSLTLYRGKHTASINPTCICGSSSFLPLSIIAIGVAFNSCCSRSPCWKNSSATSKAVCREDRERNQTWCWEISTTTGSSDIYKKKRLKSSCKVSMLKFWWVSSLSPHQHGWTYQRIQDVPAGITNGIVRTSPSW